MRLLALLTYPFNDRFMDGYVTTLGSKVYFPNRSHVDGSFDHAADVLAHEGVHIFDSQRHGLWFSISYALNQLAVLPLMVGYAILGAWIPVAVLISGILVAYCALAVSRKATASKSICRGVFFALAGLAGASYLALAVLLSGWWAALALAAFLPLAPVSSPTRARWEYRGYAMGIAIAYWRRGTVSDSFLTRRAQTFTGPDYYFMDRNSARVMDKLQRIKLDVMNNAILDGVDASPYRRTFDTMETMGLIKAESINA
jgi:hypothetical protein